MPIRLLSLEGLANSRISLMQPEISVIIPTYNTEAYVERAICSVLNQTFQDFELIVVDDGSQDRTVERIMAIADDRIQLLINRQNLGASAARNRAIAQAKGKWIALLDSDDWYAPERLQRLMEFVRSHPAEIVADDLWLAETDSSAAWSTLFKQSGRVIDTPRAIEAIQFINTDQYGKQGLHLGLTKPLINRDFLNRNRITYDETIKVTHDFWMYLHCLMAGARFFIIPEAYYFHYLRPGSLMDGSRISRLQDDIRTANGLLSTTAIQQNSELSAALMATRDNYQRYCDYYQVVEPIKTRQWQRAFQEMLRRPFFFWHFTKEIPYILWLRLELHLFQNTVAAQKAQFNSARGMPLRIKKTLARLQRPKPKALLPKLRQSPQKAKAKKSLRRL